MVGVMTRTRNRGNDKNTTGHAQNSFLWWYFEVGPKPKTGSFRQKTVFLLMLSVIMAILKTNKNNQKVFVRNFVLLLRGKHGT